MPTSRPDHRPPTTGGPAGSQVPSDPATVILILLGIAFAVMFILAMVGAGDANSTSKLSDYAYLSGIGAVPWAVLALIAWGLAGFRARSLS